MKWKGLTQEEKYAVVRKHGFEDMLLGVPLAQCPYYQYSRTFEVEKGRFVRSDTWMFKAWTEGWHAASEAQKKAVAV